jgi:uncharacterized OB-fold protein
VTREFLLAEDAFPVEYDEHDLDAEHWRGARRSQVLIQRCRRCSRFQWGPEHVCHHCHSFDLAYDEVAPRGIIHSWQRSWSASHPSLATSVPYVVVIVELEAQPGLLVVGNLTGDGRADVVIGTPVHAVFEHHEAYTLIHWAPSPV